jgi:50S ribosomal subunit-associated GTPase HflX
MEKKPRIVVLSKTDLVEDPELLDKIEQDYLEQGAPVLRVSAHRREGLRELVRLLTLRLSEMDGHP